MSYAASPALGAEAAAQQPAAESTPSGPRGIDVSHYQGTVDWSAVKASGVTFAFIKATEGTDEVDSEFQANWNGANAAGIQRGAYHFFEPQDIAAAQAMHFLKTVGSDTGELPPVLDVEISDGMTSSQIVAGIKTWLDVVQQSADVKPMIYTDPGFWNESVASDQFADYPLWVADYGVATPTLPDGWSQWTFWQYSDTGQVDGIDGDVDLDVSSGPLGEPTRRVGSRTDP